MSKLKYAKILDELENNYYDAKTELNYSNPFELLIATMLSAQCTDKQVNKVTPFLFEKYKNPYGFAHADQGVLEKEIYSCGFYRTKSKNIIQTSNILIDKYGGQVPSDIDLLRQLPGVGRKTANVVASNAFNIDAIAVDTHVFRVSNRLGLAKADNVEETEIQLMKNIPKDKWSRAHHWLIYHGRQICTARNPKCDKCFLSDYCEYHNRNILK